MYWNTVGNDLSQMYDKFTNDNLKKSEKFSFINNNFSNFIKKIKKNDLHNIEQFITSRDNNNNRVKIKTTSKSIKKQLIRHINNSGFDDYLVIPISDYSLGINVTNDFRINYMLFIKNNQHDLIKITNILGLHGFEFTKVYDNIYEFKKNIKKFDVKILVNLTDNFENDIYYKYYTRFSEIINNKDVISFIKYNISKFSPQNKIKFNIILFNFVLSKIKDCCVFLPKFYFDF